MSVRRRHGGEGEFGLLGNLVKSSTTSSVNYPLEASLNIMPLASRIL